MHLRGVDTTMINANKPYYYHHLKGSAPPYSNYICTNIVID